MPRWVRWLAPLLSGVFTVDNLDYVRRDAYLTGVAAGPIDVERLRRYTFIGADGLTLFEPGLGALEIFLTARRFMYQQVYYHRTVRAIDLDLADVFGASVRAIFGDGSPAERLAAYADLDEYALLHQAARWARGVDIATPDGAPPTPGDGRVSAGIADRWRAILLRQPTWRAEAEVRAEYEAGEQPDALIATLGERRARQGGDRSRHRGRAAGRRRRGGPVARARSARRPSAVARGGAGLDPGVLADRAALPPALSRGQLPGLALGLGLGLGGLGRSPSTSIGSIRAIWRSGSFIRLTTVGSMPNVATSAGLNSP